MNVYIDSLGDFDSDGVRVGEWFYVNNGIEDTLDGPPVYMSAFDGKFCYMMKRGICEPVPDMGTYFATKDEAIAAAIKFGYTPVDNQESAPPVTE